MAAPFNEQQFELKLVSLKDTQEAITALSDWCIKNKQHHKKIVSCWLSCLKRVKIDLRLTLFYLANDVIQHSKRKHLDFVESWGTALQKATPLVRDDKVKQRILRIFKIWEERGIYDEAFIADLSGLIAAASKRKSDASEDPADFQPAALLRKIKEVKSLKENTEAKLRKISENKLPLTDAESMRLSLKERRHGTDVAAEVDNGVKKMEAYIRSLETEIGAREKLLCLLREALLFYEKQRGEAKIVVYAYRSFGTRLKKQQQAVEELLATLQSPLPSPDVNAPSPSPDSDLEARIKQQQKTKTNANGIDMDRSLVNSSFIGSTAFLDLSADVFSLESGEPPSQKAQQIEVIGNHDTSNSFNVNEFLKTLMQQQQKEPSVPPPPTPPVFTEWNRPWDQPPPAEEPVQVQTEYQKPSQHMPNLNVGYDPSMPSMVPPLDYKPMQMPPVNFGNQMPTQLAPDFEKPMQQHMNFENAMPNTLDVDHRALGAVQDVPPRNLNPVQMHHDVDHRRPMMPGMRVPRPALNEVPPLMQQQPRPVSLLPPPPPPPIVPDIDQRNLISLTGRRGGFRGNSDRFVDAHGWNPQGRRIPEEPVIDNVESIDMDLSEDDVESHMKNDGPEHNMMMGNHPPMMRHAPQGPPPQRPSLAERLREIQSYTPKMDACYEQMPRDNGLDEQEAENNWQPRVPAHRGGRFPRPVRPGVLFQGYPPRHQGPFRARPRMFRPRGRW